MAAYSANARQTVLAGNSLVFTETLIPCDSGLIMHSDGTSQITLASPAKMSAFNPYYGGCPCQRNSMPTAMYRVSFKSNIGVTEGGTAGEISVALKVSNSILPASTMIQTPTVAGALQNVSVDIYVPVPAICGCEEISVENISANDTSVDFQNSIILISPPEIDY